MSDADLPTLSERIELAPGVTVSAGVIRFSFSRSSGPGGQNVNKRSTKAELRLFARDLPLTAAAHMRLAAQAGSLMTRDGELTITSDEHRSQIRNRAECFKKLRAIIVTACIEPKRRRKTRPTRGSVERRLDEKRARAQTKQARSRSED